MFYCEHYFVCLPFLSWVFFFCLNVSWKKSLSRCVCPPMTPFPAIPSFNVIVHIKQGAVQLNIKLSARSKALKSALGRETLNVLMSLMSLAEVENYMQFCLILYEYTMFCWIYVLLGYVKLKGSVVKYPRPCTD